MVGIIKFWSTLFWWETVVFILGWKLNSPYFAPAANGIEPRSQSSANASTRSAAEAVTKSIMGLQDPSAICFALLAISTTNAVWHGPFWLEDFHFSFQNRTDTYTLLGQVSRYHNEWLAVISFISMRWTREFGLVSERYNDIDLPRLFIIQSTDYIALGAYSIFQKVCAFAVI